MAYPEENERIKDSNEATWPTKKQGESEKRKKRVMMFSIPEDLGILYAAANE